MVLCKYTIECIINSAVFYSKTYYISYLKKKKENDSNILLITINENLLYLKIWSLFQQPLRRYCI